MLQVLLVITVDITIISMIMVNFCNYWCWTLMDDMVDRLVYLVNRSQVALVIIPVSIRV